MPSAAHSIAIRALADLSHVEAAVSLQKTIWGYSDLDTDSRALLVVASRFAGQLLGAFDGDELVGLALSFGAVNLGPPRLHSHRVGVLPAYQNLGIGRLLKLAQREHALSREIETIQWTFDPLQERNAYFNIEKLGGIARRYIPNLYGVTSSPLHGGLPTDRLLIEWDLPSDRVTRVLEGKKPPHASDARRIDIPGAASKTDPSAQLRLREEMQALFGSGYIVTGFMRSEDGCFYLMEKE